MSVNTWQSPNTWSSSGITIGITEIFSGFSEAINVSALEPGAITINMIETFGGFSEIINVKFPVTFTVNPKNIIRVKRKNNIVRVRT